VGTQRTVHILVHIEANPIHFWKSGEAEVCMSEWNMVIHWIRRLQKCTGCPLVQQFTIPTHIIWYRNTQRNSLTFVVLSADTFHPGTFLGTKREATSPEDSNGSAL